FEYVPLPGGAAAIREPWRMAVSYLAHHFGREFLSHNIPFVCQLDAAKTSLILRMIEQKINSPLTSSCGRLFDAVAALAGIRKQVNYEAQAAIELEMAILPSDRQDAYTFDLMPDGDGWIIGTRPLFAAVLSDLRKKTIVGDISRRFHNGLAQVFVQIAELVRERTALSRVCLSGGTFNNLYLSRQFESGLSEAGFEVFTHHEVPAGDGGLSLGQAVIAAASISHT
ncbi:MAG: carbamoyltransferase HypF, partial [Acidobacteriaceae bacterium]|nr:carbamoyltransferase HypF [Acidobacteriaceae bacterium]